LPAKPGQGMAAPIREGPSVPRRNGERILLVDDEANILSVTQRILVQHGYQIQAASNGKEALELLRSQNNFQAVVTDIMMPGMDGVAFAKALKQSYPHLPVIACTGWGQDGLQARLKAIGIECILQKPYPAETLLTALHQRLGGPPETESAALESH